MAAHTRDVSFRFLQLARPRTVCVQCRRTFTTTPVRQAGHNKWSKIKHVKGRLDNVKNATRSSHAEAITLYSKRTYLYTHLLKDFGSACKLTCIAI